MAQEKTFEVQALIGSPEFPKDASPEQRVMEQKLRGAGLKLTDEIAEAWVESARKVQQTAEELPPEDYQPLSEGAKAAIIAHMREHQGDFARSLALARCSEPPAGVSWLEWKTARERHLGSSYNVAPISFLYWPSGQWAGPIGAIPPSVDQRQLVEVGEDCPDIPGHLARARWSPVRPVRFV